MTSTSLVPARPGLRAGTLSALRFPNFRLYFFGQLVSLSGSWMQIVAQGWLVYQLTRDELQLGIVACAAGLPSLLLSPFAGVVVDRVPRRNILLISQTAQMTLALILAALTFSGMVQVWHIVVLAFLLGVTNAIDAPSRQAIIVDLVGHDDLTSGIALNSIMFNGSRVVGPAVAGLVLAQFGAAWCFFLNGISFLAVIAMLLRIRVTDVSRTSGDFAPLRRLREGLSFSRHHPTIAPLLLLAVMTSLFTINVDKLFPAFASLSLNSPKEGYAAIMTAVGLGALVAAVLMTPLGRHFGRGRVVSGMIVFSTLALLALTQLTALPLAVLLAGLYGFGIILQFVTMNTLIQTEVPDEFRGRVMSLYTLTFFGISPFGALALGAAARTIGTPAAMAWCALLGGLAGLAIMLRYPRVRQLL